MAKNFEKENKRLKKDIEKLKEELDIMKKVNKEILKDLNEYTTANLKNYLHKITQQKKPLPSFVKEKKPSSETKRNPKSQHKRTSRKKPTSWNNEFDLFYEKCPHCNSTELEFIEKKERFIEDIPKKKEMEVTKHNIFRCKCKHCNKIIAPKINNVLPYSRFGIRLMLKVAYMKYELRLPYDKIRVYLKDEYSLKITNKALMDIIKSLCRIFKCSYNGLKQTIRESKWVNADESGWNIDGDSAWIWGFFDAKVSIYHVDKSRSREVVRDILGYNFDGVLCTDFLSTYNIEDWKQQKCWIHLLRDTRNLAHHENACKEAKKFHAELKSLYQEATSKEPPDKEDLYKKMEKILKKKYKHVKINTLVERLNKHFYQMFTFLDYGGTADNNRAESGIRPAVIMRKISYGNRNWKCADAFSIILSHIETWKKQGLDFFEEGMKLFQNHIATPQS